MPSEYAFHSNSQCFSVWLKFNVFGWSLTCLVVVGDGYGFHSCFFPIWRRQKQRARKASEDQKQEFINDERKKTMARLKQYKMVSKTVKQSYVL